MRLIVGITHLTPVWEILLKQIAPPFEKLNSEIEWSLDNYSCIIVSGKLNTHYCERLRHFVLMGGALLSETDLVEKILKTGSSPHFVDYIDTQGDAVFDSVTSGFIGCQLSIPNGATFTQEKHGKNLIKQTTLGLGEIIILPSGLTNTLLSSSLTRRNFSSQGPWLPSERVARVSKRTVREIVEQSLKELFSNRNLPFVSLSPFPNGANSIFSFRIDTDFASRKNVDELYNLCLKYEIPATWFVETGSCESWVDIYGAMKEHEIGLHCFKHRITSKYKQNEKDIRMGKTILKRNGINPRGYAAPFGEWNSSLAKALEHHGFEYSSEFALDYDNLSFWPALEDRFSSVLQIPVHPISTGSLRNARHSTIQMIDYYETLIENHCFSKLPLFFYDHPSNTNLDVLNKVFQSIRNRNIPIMTMGEYADWWKIRSCCNWTANFQDGQLSISSNESNNRLQVIISHLNKAHSVPLAENDFSMNEIHWSPVQDTSLKHQHISVRARLNHKMIFNEILHAYWKYKL